MPIDPLDGRSDGPICPNCERRLRGNLRSEHLDARGTSEHGPQLRVGFIYCGACGWPLHSEPFTSPGASGATKVAMPSVETTLDGQFHLRCRDLISEIRALGFDPFVWVGLINDVGAVRAAKTILADYDILPVTRWLVARGLPELTLEREIEQLRWADLFNEAERVEAVRRLAQAAGPSPD